LAVEVPTESPDRIDGNHDRRQWQSGANDLTQRARERVVLEVARHQAAQPLLGPPSRRALAHWQFVDGRFILDHAPPYHPLEGPRYPSPETFEWQQKDERQHHREDHI